MNEDSLTVKEASAMLGKSEAFVRQAIINRTLPGSYNATKKSFHIPKKAFMEYMEHWRPSPTDELIIALINRYMDTKKGCPPSRRSGIQ